jgi:hypothetical protein
MKVVWKVRGLVAVLLCRGRRWLIPSCSGGSNVVVAWSSSVKPSLVWVTVVLKEPFLGWRSYYEGRLKSSRTGDSAPLLCRGRHNSITATHCRQSTNFSNDPLTCPARLLLLENASIWRRVLIKEFPHYGFFSSLPILRLRSRYSPEQTVPRHPQFMLFRNRGDHV